MARQSKKPFAGFVPFVADPVCSPVITFRWRIETVNAITMNPRASSNVAVDTSRMHADDQVRDTGVCCDLES